MNIIKGNHLKFFIFLKKSLNIIYENVEKINVNTITNIRLSMLNEKNVLFLKFIINCSSLGLKGLSEIKYITKPNKIFKKI